MAFPFLSLIHIYKYNSIGKDTKGNFELWLRTELSPEEKDSLIWSWGELVRLRLIAPTGTDLVSPDEWVKATERGIASIEGRSFTEYEEIEVFVAKGEVFTAFRSLQRIFEQSRSKVIIIDPYTDETVLDHIAALAPSVQVQLLTDVYKRQPSKLSIGGRWIGIKKRLHLRIELLGVVPGF